MILIDKTQRYAARDEQLEIWKSVDQSFCVKNWNHSGMCENKSENTTLIPDQLFRLIFCSQQVISHTQNCYRLSTNFYGKKLALSRTKY